MCIRDRVRGPRVAVVGAGPSGLSAADTLARLGCLVTVFDPYGEPGGMMRYGAAEGFGAVLIAVGAREALRLPAAGGEEQGFHDALSFLVRVRERRFPRLQGRVVVIGG